MQDQAVPRADNPQRLLFVIGLWRSGTSLIHALLNRHPQIALLYEAEPLVLWPGRFSAPSADWPYRLEFFNHTFTRHNLDPAAFASINPGADAALALYREYGRARGATIIGEKAPFYYRKLPLLAQLFPDAQFLVIWRDPIDCCRSAAQAARYNRFFSRPGTLQRMLFGAEAMAEGVETLLRNKRSVCEVVYDELVKNPEAEMRRVCGFLNLPFAPEMLDLKSADTSSLPSGEHHRSVRSGVIGKSSQTQEILPAAFIAKGRRYAQFWKTRFSRLAFPRALPPATTTRAGPAERARDALASDFWRSADVLIKCFWRTRRLPLRGDEGVADASRRSKSQPAAGQPGAQKQPATDTGDTAFQRKRRRRVLISAFACEPYRGSEPEVGWQWAWQMARFHEVTVLTISEHRPAIERGLKDMANVQPQPSFVYYDLPKWMEKVKRSSEIGLRIYYVLWQKWARGEVRRLHQENPFALLHHVTYAAFRYPAVIWDQGVPCVWGPVGGIESIPTELLPWRHPVSLIQEILRNLSNLVQAAPYNDLPKRAAASDKVLVPTVEMKSVLAKLGIESDLMPTIGLHTKELPFRPHRRPEGPLRLLLVGKVITLKGIDLAIEALAASGTDATLTFIGTGNYLPAARRLVARLGLENRVFFRGLLPRQEVLNIYPEFDVKLFPGLHDTGGYAVIEAMFNELPVICLDTGGPAVAVREDCGIKVAVHSRRGVIEGLAAAIRRYDQDREMLLAHGKVARQVILENYDWNEKGPQMNAVYEEVWSRTKRAPGRSKYFRPLLSPASLFSLRGSVLAAIALLLIGTLGFLSLDHLKYKASLIVNDTLPGLSYAGEANAYIVDASRTLLFIVDKDPQRRKQIRDDIDTFSARTTKYLALYRTQIYNSEDASNFQAVVQMRGDYIQIRNHVLDVASAGNDQEAMTLYNNSLMPIHARVKKAADRMFEYNMNQGDVRGKEIMQFCTVTQVALAVASVLIFAIGFFLGLFK